MVSAKQDFQSDAAGLPLLARLRHADRLGNCPFIGVDRKWPDRGQNDAIDPDMQRRRTCQSNAAVESVEAPAYEFIRPRCVSSAGIESLICGVQRDPQYYAGLRTGLSITVS